jgi:hypothetical protein
MFDLGIRQKDMIGEWAPRSKPGVTDVFSRAVVDGRAVGGDRRAVCLEASVEQVGDPRRDHRI